MRSNDIYSYIVKSWHPTCIIYLAKLYLSLKLFQKVLILFFFIYIGS